MGNHRKRDRPYSECEYGRGKAIFQQALWPTERRAVHRWGCGCSTDQGNV